MYVKVLKMVLRRISLVAVLLIVTLLAGAKGKPNAYGKGVGKVYIFGVTMQLTDSIVYITSINEVDSIDLDKKTKFLPFRSEFSLQLKEYMEGKLQAQHQTSCVYYSPNRKKIARKFYKIKKRYLDNAYTRVVMLDDKQFKFKHPLESIAYEEKE